MPTPRRSLSELRTEAAAALAIPDVALVTKLKLPPAGAYWASFDFSPDGRILFVADSNTGLNAWDVTTNHHLFSVPTFAIGNNTRLLTCLPGNQGMAVGTTDTYWSPRKSDDSMTNRASW